MRPYCLDCTIKHLAQAMITQNEAQMGYPHHILLTIGHLAEASEESIAISPDIALKIRQYRLLIMESIEAEVPYFDLYKEILSIIEKHGCGDCKKAKESFREKLSKKRIED